MFKLIIRKNSVGRLQLCSHHFDLKQLQPELKIMVFSAFEKYLIAKKIYFYYMGAQ